jgi:hypothetical protein
VNGKTAHRYKTSQIGRSSIETRTDNRPIVN